MINLLLCISGGVSAYKSLFLLRLLKKEQFNVKVILSDNALKFVTPLSVESLNDEPPFHQLWKDEGNMPINISSMPHIDLAKWADCIVLAPASANRIAEITQGIANDLLSNTLLAKPENCPIAIAPAMNKEMWNNSSVQNNINILKQRNVKIFEPADGMQACGDVGIGRLLEPKELLQQIKQWIQPITINCNKVVISGGATAEPIDPVRFISNRSSGKMSVELCKQFALGHNKVVFIYANIDTKILNQLPQSVTKIKVNTTQEMLDLLQQQLHEKDLFISCAAVSDYRIDMPSKQKIKSDEQNISLKLCKNPDILATLSKSKNNIFNVGFALESENLEKNAIKKLQQKNLKLIIANSIEAMDSDNIELTAFWLDNSKKIQKSHLPNNTKHYQAKELYKIIAQLYQ